MVKKAIPLLLSHFQETDTRESSLGCLQIHVVVWYVYFLVIELAFSSILALVYAITIRQLSWPAVLSISILLILFFTLFVGIYAIYSEKTRHFRWFSLRTKLVYYTIFLWAMINYFTNPTLKEFVLSAVWALGAVVFVFEDYAIIRAMDFMRYRYRGLNNKDDVRKDANNSCC